MSIISNGVAIANKVTKALKMQGTVSWEVGVTDGYGALSYPSGIVSVQAIIDWRQRQVKSRGGQMVTCRATLTILDPTVTVGFNDRLTLPDGTTGAILNMSGPTDDSGLPVMRDVYLG